jgi:hypothetical protein
MQGATPGFAHPIGVSMGDMVPPERIGATLALGATDSVPVGTSIVSGMVRHPAVLAMEIAGIGRVFPRRFRPGNASRTQPC